MRYNQKIGLEAPTVTATDAYRVSDRYSQVPTTQITDRLLADGWTFAAGTTRYVRSTVADADIRQAHALHTLRFGHPALGRVMGSDPQLVLTNSHDGTSPLRLEFGLYRLICTNGLVVCSAACPGISMRHVGLTLDLVQNAVTGILERAPTYVQSIEGWQGQKLSAEQQLEMATQCARVRWGLAASGICAADLLRVRRLADYGDDLWRVFNRVQEAVIRGGVRIRRFDAAGVVTSHNRTPGVRGVAESLRINREVWQIAESFAA